MICKFCKRQIDDDSIFCKWCGERQVKERKKKSEISVPAPRLLPSGTWFGRLMLNGERVSVSAPSEKEYYAKARAIKAGLIEAEKHRAKLTLQQAIRKYIDSNTAVLSPSTIRGYEIIIENRFKDYMGKDIMAIDYQQMINTEAQKLAAKSVINSWGLVRRSLEAAGADIPKVNLPKLAQYMGDWLDYEQIKVFLAAIKGQPAEAASLLALHSLRQSELLDLTAESIKNGEIIVAGATVQDKNNKFVHKATNKNKTSARTVPVLIPRLLELVPEEGKIVTLHPSSIRRGLEKACLSSGLPVCSLHDLRRSFASLAYHLKWSDRTTMLVGGWSDMKTVRAVYEKLAEADKAGDIQRMKEFYKNGNEIGNEI